MSDYDPLGDVITGLEIIKKYYGDRGCSFEAEHDQIWAGTDSLDLTEEDRRGDVTKDPSMSEEDNSKMDEAGWFIDTNIMRWSKFV